MTSKIVSMDSAASLIRDGDQIVMSGGMDWSPMALLRAAVRRDIRELRAVGVVGGTIDMDFLIGAGAVASVDTCSVAFHPYARNAPNFVRHLTRGRIKMLDNT